MATLSSELVYNTGANRQDTAGLASIEKADTDKCQCDYSTHTVRNILLECGEWLEEREKMWAGKTPCVDIELILCSLSTVDRTARSMPSGLAHSTQINSIHE